LPESVPVGRKLKLTVTFIRREVYPEQSWEDRGTCRRESCRAHTHSSYKKI